MFSVATFYRFFTPEDSKALHARIDGARVDRFANEDGVQGIVLVGPQGINATVAGSDAALKNYISFLEECAGHRFENVKRSYAEKSPFKRLRVRFQNELITFGKPESDPTKASPGTYVEPKDWNDLISREDVVLLDTRNDYELRVGTFAGAVDPQIESFTEFADYVDKHLSPEKNPKVAMFCTGGVRCEVATTYLLQHGFNEVFHLKGGILKYLEEIPEEESKWQGECFVFDGRVTVGHDLQRGTYDLCVACSWPTPKEDVQNRSYEDGACCAHCHASLSPEHLARAKERWRQREQKSLQQKPAPQQAGEKGMQA